MNLDTDRSDWVSDVVIKMSLIGTHDTLRICWIPVDHETILEITGSKKKQINSSVPKGKTSSPSSMMGRDAGMNPESINSLFMALKPQASEFESDKADDYEADASEEEIKTGQGTKNPLSSTPLTESFNQQFASLRAISAERTSSVKTEVVNERELRLISLRCQLEEAENRARV
jgi:hypothetical protein